LIGCSGLYVHNCNVNLVQMAFVVLVSNVVNLLFGNLVYYMSSTVLVYRFILVHICGSYLWESLVDSEGSSLFSVANGGMELWFIISLEILILLVI